MDEYLVSHMAQGVTHMVAKNTMHLKLILSDNGKAHMKAKWAAQLRVTMVLAADELLVKGSKYILGVTIHIFNLILLSKDTFCTFVSSFQGLFIKV